MVGIVTTPDDFMTIKELEADGLWPKSWTSINGLIPYIKRLGPNLVGLEVGTARGESAYVLLDQCKNISMLYSIDPYVAYDDWNGHVGQEINDKTYEIAIKNMEQFGDRFELLNETTKETIDRRTNRKSDYPEKEFDFIFIDGDHSYDGAKYDMENFYPLLKKHGFFAGHDWNLEPVRKALMYFREENKIRIPINNSTNQTWFWTKS